MKNTKPISVTKKTKAELFFDEFDIDEGLKKFVGKKNYPTIDKLPTLSSKKSEKP